MTFKPMRAAGPDPKKGEDHFFKSMRYPLLGSPKIDGIRGVVRGNQVTSRSGDPIRSYQVQEEIGGNLSYTDGELIIGNVTDFGVYNRTQSHVMAYDKPGDLWYYVFDSVLDDQLHLPFYERLESAKREVLRVQSIRPDLQVAFVEHTEIESYDEMVAYEEAQLALGYEGIMLRDPVAPYKQGQSTINQGWMYKVKRFTDTEAIIVGFEEQMTNTNTQERSALGYAKRSSAKEGLVPAGTLGKFIVNWNGVELPVGCGVFTHEERQHIWWHRESHLGMFLKFRYFAHGVKDLPRFPRALGFRDKMDL